MNDEKTLFKFSIIVFKESPFLQVKRSRSELYPQGQSVDPAKVKTAQKNGEAPTIKLSDAAQKIRETNPLETKNAQKVAEIKRAIQEGTYKVSAEEIANNMWQGMKENK